VFWLYGSDEDFTKPLSRFRECVLTGTAEGETKSYYMRPYPPGTISGWAEKLSKAVFSMNIALLFDCTLPEYGGIYKWPINNKVFSTGIIQASGRHMKAWIGDVLIYSYAETLADYHALCDRVYFTHKWARLHEARLRATFWHSTVYTLLFENMTRDIANKLHDALTSDNGYLGLQAVDYAYYPHLIMYRNSLVPSYRVHGQSCTIFYFIGQDFCRNEEDFSRMQQLGYDVAWEYRGAHNTYFDEYNTPEHFQQIENFRAVVAPHIGENEADELVMVLEDLNPGLFNALGAAMDALEHARTEEHVAQVAVSGRRYLEQLADVLFPAQDNEHNGRKVGKAEYRNRIWAFIADNAASDGTLLCNLGRATDHLTEEFNACLHGEQPQDRVRRALVNAAELTAALLALIPAGTRQPYFAFRKTLLQFFKRRINGKRA
jgi:hypothetical protein